MLYKIFLLLSESSYVSNAGFFRCGIYPTILLQEPLPDFLPPFSVQSPVDSRWITFVSVCMVRKFKDGSRMRDTSRCTAENPMIWLWI